jgi:hypothetical protein
MPRERLFFTLPPDSDPLTENVFTKTPCNLSSQKAPRGYLLWALCNILLRAWQSAIAIDVLGQCVFAAKSQKLKETVEHGANCAESFRIKKRNHSSILSEPPY